MTDEHKKKISDSMLGNNNAIKRKKLKIGKTDVHVIAINKELQALEDPFNESKIDIIIPKYSMAGFGHYFETNEYHASACKFKADAVVGQGYEIQPIDPLNKNKDAEYNRLNTFLNNANPDESFEMILRKCWLDYEIFGNLYMELDITKSGKLIALGHLPAQTIRKAGNKKGFWQLYNNAIKEKYFDLYKHSDYFKYSTEIKEPVNPLVQLKNYYYGSSFYGYPDILSALAVMYLDQQLIKYNENFFANNAIPEGILVYTNTEIDESTLAKIQDYHKSNFKGNDNSRRMLILTAEGENASIDFMDLSGKKDLAFDELHKMTRDRILTAHRLPPKIAGTITAGELGQSNQSYAEMQMFQELVINPRQHQLEFMLNMIFKNTLNINKWKLVLSNYDYTPDTQDAEYVMTLWNDGVGIISKDEARIHLKIPVIDDTSQDVEPDKIINKE